MPNIQNIPILYNPQGVDLGGAITPVDLSSGTCNKTLTTSYLLPNGTSFDLYDYPIMGSRLVTLITDLSNNTSWVTALSPAVIAKLFTEDCATKSAGASCDNPLFVNVCNSVGGGTTPAQIDVVQVTICDTTTQTWHYVTTVYTDGVAGTPISQDSGKPCSQPQPTPPTIEKIDICDNATKTIHTQVWKYTFDNLGAVVEALVSDVDTGVECNVKYKVLTGLKNLDSGYPLVDPNVANTYDGDITKYRSLSFVGVRIEIGASIEVTDVFGNVTTFNSNSTMPSLNWSIDTAGTDTGLVLPRIEIIGDAEGLIAFTIQQ